MQNTIRKILMLVISLGIILWGGVVIKYSLNYITISDNIIKILRKGAPILFGAFALLCGIILEVYSVKMIFFSKQSIAHTCYRRRFALGPIN